jgi:hypothetical protein
MKLLGSCFPASFIHTGNHDFFLGGLESLYLTYI